MARAGSKEKALDPPLWFLAELTYRCPLACPYCSNPLDYQAVDAEPDWLAVDLDTLVQLLRHRHRTPCGKAQPA